MNDRDGKSLAKEMGIEICFLNELIRGDKKTPDRIEQIERIMKG